MTLAERVNLGDKRFGLVAEDLFAAECVDGDVVRDAEEPARAVVGDALVGPRLQRPQHGLLDAFFGEGDVGGAEQPGQAGDHAARLMPEQVLDEDARLARVDHDPYSCRTSIVPPYSKVGVFERARDGFVVVRGFDRVEAAEDFLRLAVRTVGRARLAAVRSDHAPGVLAESLAVDGERLLGPRHVFLDGLLHVFRSELCPLGWIVVEQEHEFRHDVFLAT